MTSNWNDLVSKADIFIKYLENRSFFEKSYSGIPSNKLIITSASLGIDYACNDSFDTFDEWETVSYSPDLFPTDFEWNRWIDYNLKKNNYFDFVSGNFHGADKKWTQSGVCLLTELMHRDIRTVLNCYANNFFPKIWKDILDAYLHDGFPCGWSGHAPQGKLVIFSNF